VVQTIDIEGIGEVDFPDEMSGADITYAIENDIIPNFGDPDPAMVARRPDLFPDIERGSLFGGFGSAAERYGRIPEVAGAVAGSQEELDALRAQQEAEGQEQRYRANLKDATAQYERGDVLGAASTLFLDILPQTLGESLPDMTLIGLGTYAGGKTGAIAGAAVAGPPGAVIGGALGSVAGAVVAGFPSFFGMNIERQVEARDITTPEDIEPGRAAGAAVFQAGLEGALFKVLSKLPGVSALKDKTVAEMVKAGAKTMSTRQGLAMMGKAVGGAVVTEGMTETMQQVLERAQARLPIDPSDQEAMDEYIESMVLGGLLGGVFGTGAGAYSTMKVRQAIPEYNAVLDQLNADLAARQEEAARRAAVDVGAIPDPDAPYGRDDSGKPILLLGTRIEVTPHEGTPEENVTEEVNNRINRHDETFRYEQDQRLFEEARLAVLGDKTVEQHSAVSIATTARENLKTTRYTLAQMEELGAEKLAKAVMEREAGRGDTTVEQDEFTIEELEEAGKVTGLTPNEIRDDLQILQGDRRPETERINNVTEAEILDLAKEKNIITGDRDFSSLVNYMTGAETLRGADPFRMDLMKRFLEQVEPFSHPQPLMNKIRVENYTHEDYQKAVKHVALVNKDQSRQET